MLPSSRDFRLLLLLQWISLFLIPSTKSAYQGAGRKKNIFDRRTWIHRAVLGHAPFIVTLGSSPLSLRPPHAHASSGTTSTVSSDLMVRSKLLSIQQTLQELLDNWQRAVVDCTYADVPRELLDTKNKDLLLEKASTYALLDKSVGITSCKTANTVVRDYLGLRGIGPVTGLDKTIKQNIDHYLDESDNGAVVTDMETFVETAQDLLHAWSRADSYSYSARRDSTSINNFAPEEAKSVLADDTSNFAPCKAEITTMVQDLNILIKLLPKE